MSSDLSYIINIRIIGLFLYTKLLLHKDKSIKQYKGFFNFFNSVFATILNFLKGFIKPFEVGQGISVDMTQIILLIVLLFISNIYN